MNALTHSPFRGRFEIKLDPKGRLSLPPAFRELLTAPKAPKTTKNGQPELIITNSRYEGRNCLHAYTMTEWEKLERRIAKMSSLKTEVQAFSRFYLSGGQAVEVDGQNRILVPQSLRRFAGLDTQAVLIGMGGKFEVWSSETWNAVFDKLTESFEATMSAVAALEEGDAE